MCAHCEIVGLENHFKWEAPMSLTGLTFQAVYSGALRSLQRVDGRETFFITEPFRWVN